MSKESIANPRGRWRSRRGQGAGEALGRWPGEALGKGRGRHLAASRDWCLGQDEQDSQDPQECAWGGGFAPGIGILVERLRSGQWPGAAAWLAISWRSWESCLSWSAHQKMKSLAGSPPTSSGNPCGWSAKCYKRAAKAMLQARPLSPPAMRVSASRASRAISAAVISPMPCMRR